MATLLQQPDLYSFSGNLKKIIIASDNNIVFQLKKESTVLIETSYSPDLNGRIEIDIKKVVEDTLVSTLPVGDQSSDFSEFSFIIDAGAQQLFYAFEGGVDATVTNVWFTQNFLTWQPQTAYVTWQQPQFLSYISLQNSVLKAKGYFKDEEDQVIDLATFYANKINTTSLQYATLPDKFGGLQPLYVDVWVENIGGDRLSYIQRFILKNATADDDYFLFKNSLGGWDSVVLTGMLKNEGNSDPKSYTQDDVTNEYQVDYLEKFSKNTGYFTSEHHRIWVNEFFKTNERYFLSQKGIFERINVTSSSLFSQKRNPSAFDFTFTLSKSTKYLNLPRVDNPESPLELVGPEEVLFFLAPRLSEFSEATLTDDILFPVQSPFLRVWKKTSWGAIWEFLYTKLFESTIGQLAHLHSNLPVIANFSEQEGKLKYKGESIIPDGGLGVQLGESSTTAYRGDRGKIAYDHSQSTEVHFADVPNNDATYGRKNKQWVALTTPGSAAVRLSTNKQVFEYDDAGNIIDADAYAFIYTSLFNISGDSIYYEFRLNGNTLQNGIWSVLTYVPPAIYGSPDVISVYVRVGSASSSVIAFDTISMYGIKPGADGQDAYTIVLSNPAHAFPADANGNVTDYSGSGTDIRVWKGIVALDYGAGALTFSVSAAGTNVNSGTASTVNANIRRYGNANNMVSATAAINFTISVRDENSAETVFMQVMTFAISKAGQDGEDGNDGSPGPSLVFRGEYNAAATYVGNSKRIDMVKYTTNGKYYAALMTAGSFSGIAPIDSQYWQIADGQFEFVATKLLFAESTYVRNLIAEQLKTAESGRRVEINAGDKQQIAIYDASESLKVLVKPEPISTLAVIQSGSATANHSTTADVATKNSNWATPNFGSITYRQESATFVVTLDGTLEIEIGAISLTAGKSDGTYCAALSTVSVILEKYTYGAWNFVALIGSCSEYESSKSVSETIKGLTAGTYRLVAVHEHFSWTDWISGMPEIQDSCSAFSRWNYYSGSAFAITVRRVIAQTEIGTDGIASIWATNKYLHFSQNGLFIKMGTKTFEVSEAGVKINGIIHN